MNETPMMAEVKRESGILIKNHHKSGNEYWMELEITGWDDVAKHNKHVLMFEGREYGWSCWNSDRMVSVFKSPLPSHRQFATVKK